MKKRLTITASVLFVAALLLISISAHTLKVNAGTITHQGKSGDINWTIDSDGLLTIYGEGNFEKSNSGVYLIDRYGNEIFWPDQVYGWKEYADEIKTAEVRVKGCDSMERLLGGLKNLESVDFTGSDTSKVKCFYYMLCGDVDENTGEGISSLKSVNVSCLDTSSAIDMSGIFANCVHLKEVDITGWNTFNATDFTSMFNGCYEIEKIKGIEDLDVRNVRDISLMFYRNYALKGLDLSKWRTTNLKEMMSSFGESDTITGSIKLLSNDIEDYDIAFHYVTFGGETGCFTIYYVPEKCSYETAKKIADSASNPAGINIIEINEGGNHTWDNEYTIDIDPTSEMAGSKSIHCSVCDSIKEGSSIPIEYGSSDPEPADSDWHVVKEATCTETGIKERTVNGKNETQTIPAKGHKWNASYTVDKKATLTANGSKSIHCSVCGAKKSVTSIPIPKTFKLSATKYVYDGSVKKPAVTVTDANGTKLVSGTDYSLSYSSGCKNVGKRSVTVNMKGAYTGSKVLEFKIYPKPTTLKSVTAEPIGITVNWNKMATQTTGYQIEYSTDSKFKSDSKQVRITSSKTVTENLIGLQPKKKYYVRIRTYTHFDGYNLYSTWSTAKAVKTNAININDKALYLVQGPGLNHGGNKCTLYAYAHMMIRKTIIDRKYGWEKRINKDTLDTNGSALCKAAWDPGLAGTIVFSPTENSKYKLTGSCITLKNTKKETEYLTVEDIKKLLKKHPEGVVLFDNRSKSTHAVLAVSVNSKNIVYCIDSGIFNTKKDKNGKIVTDKKGNAIRENKGVIKLTSSYLGTISHKGASQEKILKYIGKYWYIH